MILSDRPYLHSGILSIPVSNVLGYFPDISAITRQPRQSPIASVAFALQTGT